jgi:hypothetical protein
MNEATIDSRPTKTKHSKIKETVETIDDKIMEAAETFNNKIKEADEDKDARGVRIK